MRIFFFLFCLCVCKWGICTVTTKKNTVFNEKNATYDYLYQKNTINTPLWDEVLFKEKLPITMISLVGKMPQSLQTSVLTMKKKTRQRADFKLSLGLLLMAFFTAFVSIINYVFFRKNKKITHRLNQLTVVKSTAYEELQQLKKSLQDKEKELSIVYQNLQEREYTLQSVQQNLHKLQHTQEQASHKQNLLNLMAKLQEEGTINGHWEQLQMQFELVHPNFYPKLQEGNSKLTKSNLRLCTYIKLGMDTKKIARMTHVSIEAVSKAKYRLKKKLKLSSKEQLDQFIHQL